jgi:hypothetical protein
VDGNLHYPLNPIVKGWLEKIECGKKRKRAFDEDAQEAMNFYDGPCQHMWNNKYAREGRHSYLSRDAELRLPTFRMTVNKVAEMVQLFGPALYAQNPHRSVNARARAPLTPELFGDPMMDPMVQMFFPILMQQDETEQRRKESVAKIYEQYLNYTPGELDLMSNSRQVIDEALIKGLGLWFTELYQPPGFQNKLVGSFYRTVDDLILDPDAEEWGGLKWMAVRCVHPYYEVEREYGLPEGSLKNKASLESARKQGAGSTDPDRNLDRERGESNDLLVYYKVFSKMGFGDKMTGFGKFGGLGELREGSPTKALFESFGDYCYLVVAEGIPFPLNMAPGATNAGFDSSEMMQQSLTESVQWPIPFWVDNEWPVTPLEFHRKPNSLYPVSHLKPGLGELKFLNWAMSYLADKVMATSNLILGVVKAASENVKESISKGTCGLSVVELENALGKNINEIMSFIQAPQFSTDIYVVIEKVSEAFDKRVGLSELLYGMAEAQSRSATDVQVRQSNASTRVNDMRARVEQAMSKLARKEALAMRWTHTVEDLAPIVGPLRATLAAPHIFNHPIEETVREYDYVIAAGSTSVPNKMTEQGNVNGALQTFMPLFTSLLSLGQVGPINAAMLRWGEAYDMDMTDFMVMPPPPPMMPGEEGPTDQPPQDQAA